MLQDASPNDAARAALVMARATVTNPKAPLSARKKSEVIIALPFEDLVSRIEEAREQGSRVDIFDRGPSETGPQAGNPVPVHKGKNRVAVRKDTSKSERHSNKLKSARNAAARTQHSKTRKRFFS